MRIGDPALPLLQPHADVDAEARRLLQFDTIKNLPEALAEVESPNMRLWAHRLAPALPLLVLAGVRAYSSASRKSTPISSTARKFLR